MKVKKGVSQTKRKPVIRRSQPPLSSLGSWSSRATNFTTAPNKSHDPAPGEAESPSSLLAVSSGPSLCAGMEITASPVGWATTREKVALRISSRLQEMAALGNERQC